MSCAAMLLNWCLLGWNGRASGGTMVVRASAHLQERGQDRLFLEIKI